MISFTKTIIPDEIYAKMEPIKNDDEAVRKFGTEYLANFCQDMINNGHKFLHFYTMNLEKPVIDIIQHLGVLRQKEKSLPFK